LDRKVGLSRDCACRIKMRYCFEVGVRMPRSVWAFEWGEGAADGEVSSRQRDGGQGRTASQIVFRFVLDVGMVPLTGTSDASHMRADLDAFDFRMDPEEVERIELLGS
jgi:aryl-alcohol dehydrogenase-like predicted oxidoreductase